MKTIITIAAKQLSDRLQTTVETAQQLIESAAKSAKVDFNSVPSLTDFLLKAFGVGDYTRVAGTPFLTADFSEEPEQLYGIAALRGKQWNNDIDLNSDSARTQIDNVARQLAKVENIDYETAVVRTTNALIRGEDLV